MRVLFWGLGSIGRRHAKLLKELYPEVEIIAIRSRRSLNKGLGEITGIINVFSEEEAFKSQPDIVFVTNPTSMHVDSAIKAAEKDCHLFIEKPLSNDLKNVDKLIKLVKRKELITLMGCNLRFNPVILKIKEIIEQQKLGKPLTFRATCGSYLPNWRPWQDYRKSYSARKDLGGGVVLDLIHELDYTYWIFGEFTECRGLLRKLSALEIETEDCAEIIVETKKGIIGSIHLDYFTKVPERFIKVTFQHGIIKGDLINNTVTIEQKNKQEKTKFKFDRDFTYREQLKYFINCVKSNTETFNNVETGYKVLKYALNLKRENCL